MARTELTFPSGRYPTTDKRDLLIFCGPTIEVNIGLDQSYDEQRPEITPRLQVRGERALIDTGATTNYIDARLAKKLGLPEIDKEYVTTALGGRQTISTYMAHLHIPSLAFTLTGSFGGLDLAPLHVAAVLGREFLMNWRMTYDGTRGVVSIES